MPGTRSKLRRTHERTRWQAGRGPQAKTSTSSQPQHGGEVKAAGPTQAAGLDIPTRGNPKQRKLKGWCLCKPKPLPQGSAVGHCEPAGSTQAAGLKNQNAAPGGAVKAAGPTQAAGLRNQKAAPGGAVKAAGPTQAAGLKNQSKLCY